MILTGCVLVSIVLLRVQARQQFHEDQAAAFANDEWFIAERRKAATPKKQAWLRKHAWYITASAQIGPGALDESGRND